MVRERTVAALLPWLGHLVGLLRVPGCGSSAAEPLPELPELPMPYGTLRPPLGSSRLRIVELLALLVRKGGAEAEAALISTGAVRACLELFRCFPFNNMLHHKVQAIILGALEQQGPLGAHLLGDCDVLSWLAVLPRQVDPEPRPG